MFSELVFLNHTTKSFLKEIDHTTSSRKGDKENLHKN